MRFSRIISLSLPSSQRLPSKTYSAALWKYRVRPETKSTERLRKPATTSSKRKAKRENLGGMRAAISFLFFCFFLPSNFVFHCFYAYKKPRGRCRGCYRVLAKNLPTAVRARCKKVSTQCLTCPDNPFFCHPCFKKMARKDRRTCAGVKMLQAKTFDVLLNEVAL